MPREAAYFLLKIGVVVALLFGLAAVCTAQVPTPTPGTPEEWADWLDGQGDVEVIISSEYDPVVTVAGTHAMPRSAIKQSISAGVAVEMEHGYAEAVSPIDPKEIGGLRFQGFVTTALADPILTAGGERKPDDPGPRPRPTPDHAGPRPRPTPQLPENSRRPVRPGDETPEGRVSRVTISADPIPGGVEKRAVVVPAITLLDGPVTGKVEVEKIPWDSSYAVRRGRVFYRVEVEE